MTKKLHETDGHLSVFEAKVLSCVETDGKFAVVLDKTAFFHEGGGQLADVGKIADATVFDVQIKDGEIVHYTDKSFRVGEVVDCEVDMTVRFPRMQCHSGEHIVSGLIHAEYGYNNVGFHLGTKDTTLDFDGELTEYELAKIEHLANEAVAKNVPVNIKFPSPEELKTLSYRSKLELEGDVRIVEVEGYDVCACCAPHVSRTGEIGIIKFLDHIRYKGGIRIHMQCGFRALWDYGQRYADNVKIAEFLSVKQNECPEAVFRLAEQLEAAKRDRSNAIREVLLEEVERARLTEGNLVFIKSGVFLSGIREAANAAAAKCGGIAAFFAGEDGAYNFVLVSERVNLKEKADKYLRELGAKGGGSPSMVQGKAECSAEEIKRVFLNMEV